MELWTLDIRVGESNHQVRVESCLSQSNVQESLESQTEQYHLYIVIIDTYIDIRTYRSPNWHRILARISILAVFVSFSGECRKNCSPSDSAPFLSCLVCLKPLSVRCVLSSSLVKTWSFRRKYSGFKGNQRWHKKWRIYYIAIWS